MNVVDTAVQQVKEQAYSKPSTHHNIPIKTDFSTGYRTFKNIVSMLKRREDTMKVSPVHLTKYLTGYLNSLPEIERNELIKYGFLDSKEQLTPHGYRAFLDLMLDERNMNE